MDTEGGKEATGRDRYQSSEMQKRCEEQTERLERSLTFKGGGGGGVEVGGNEEKGELLCTATI